MAHRDDVAKSLSGDWRRFGAGDVRWLNAVLNVLAIVGGVLTIGVIAWGISGGYFRRPRGDVANYLAAGRRLIDGGTVYAGVWNTPGTVYYAPPIVVAFGAFTFLPPWLVWIALCMLDLAGLRYIAGSWRAAGLWGLVPAYRFRTRAVATRISRSWRRSCWPPAAPPDRWPWRP